MSDEKKFYVYNKHNAPVSVNIRDDGGRIKETIKFLPEITDPSTGRVISTGYTTLSEKQYNHVKAKSKTFMQYANVLKLLSVKDELPASAKAPHEALRDARAAEQKLAAKLATAETEIDALKAKLLDSETKYKELSSASTDAEKVKGYTDKIAEQDKRITELGAHLSEQVNKVSELETQLAAAQGSGNEKGKK